MRITGAGHGAERGRIPSGLRAVGIAALVFGLATIAAGGLVLFGPEAARAAAGRAVPFVVWSNFLLGFAYVAAGAGLARGRPWAAAVAAGIALATGAVALAFVARAVRGGAFEPRTAWALPLRALVWTGIAWWARRRCAHLPVPHGGA